MFDLRPINAILGVIITLLGALMLPPAIMDLMAGSKDWMVFAVSSAVSVFMGIGLWASGLGAKRAALSIRQMVLLANLAWAVTAGFAALPFMWAEVKLSFPQAYFEALSGLTTTGSTVITGLDKLPPGLLLWRALLHFYGGIGVVGMAVAILPLLNVGGMQLFRAETPNRPHGHSPLAAQLMASIIGLYVILNLACVMAFILAGMKPFDALIYGIGIVATGGFSSHDASLAYFHQPAFEWIAVVFMLAGALPFVLYLHALRGRIMALARNPELRFFLLIIAAATLVLWLHQEWNGLNHGPAALRYALFSVVSLITTTGLTAVDHSTWGAFVSILLCLLAFIGGCVGSASGGLRPFRFRIMGSACAQQLKKIIYPNGIFPITYAGRAVAEEIRTSIFVFFTLYLAVFAMGVLALGLCGLEFAAALTAALSSLTSAGPALGNVQFSAMSQPALWTLSALMLIGRMEIFAVLALLVPRFWRG